MSEATNKASAQNLADRIRQVKNDSGNLTIEGIMAIHQELLAEATSETEAVIETMHTELEEIAERLEKARTEILTLVQQGKEVAEDPGNQLHISHAADQLDAVIKATEDASHTIMDAADVIQEHMSEANPELQEKVMPHVMSLYESCSFQDITSQRLTKVFSTFEHIEEKIHHMISIFDGREHVMQEKDVHQDAKEGLLEGPQLEEKAVSQDDIDALFG